MNGPLPPCDPVIAARIHRLEADLENERRRSASLTISRDMALQLAGERLQQVQSLRLELTAAGDTSGLARPPYTDPLMRARGEALRERRRADAFEERLLAAEQAAEPCGRFACPRGRSGLVAGRSAHVQPA